MNRRELIIGASLIASQAAARVPVFGAANLNKYANNANWTLDPVIHPIVTAPTGRTLVVLWAGQSNMAQYANAVYTPVHTDKQYQFLYGDGTLRAFVEPVFGPPVPYPGGNVGSWFGQFGDLIIGSGEYDNVIHCLTAIGGTGADEWGPSGRYHSILTTAFFRLLDAGLQPTFCGVGQGEHETALHLPGSAWLPPWTDVVTVARNMGISGPWLFAKETLNVGVGISVSVQQAQHDITMLLPNVLAGPDIDAIGADKRYDGVHPSAAGCAAMAAAWCNSVLALP